MPLRLALYSDQEIPANRIVDERLLRLIGVDRPTIAYFSSTPDSERFYFERKRAYYAKLGASLDCYVDLKSTPLEDSVASALRCDAIHLSGGNTYAFLRWLQDYRLLDALRTYAQEQGVLIGTSAGAILMTPDICTAALCGDIPDPLLTDHRGLGLTSFQFLPHFDSKGMPPAAWKHLVRPTSPIYACPDGSGVIVEGGVIETYGQVATLHFSSDAQQVGQHGAATVGGGFAATVVARLPQTLERTDPHA